MDINTRNFKDKEGNKGGGKEIIPGNASFREFKSKFMFEILPKVREAFKRTKEIAEKWYGKGKYEMEIS